MSQCLGYFGDRDCPEKVEYRIESHHRYHHSDQVSKRYYCEKHFHQMRAFIEECQRQERQIKEPHTLNTIDCKL